jgi:micrococcal nuclease
MNRNLFILIAGMTAIGFITIATNPDIQKSIGLDQAQSSTKTSSKKKKSTTINKTSEGIETAKIQRVVDGDTIELDDGRKVRLLNMDTPETVKPSTPVQCYGKEASDFSKKVLTDKVVQLVSDKDPNDRYGRSLRMVYLQGKDTSKVEESYNAELVRNGFARVKSYSPNKTFEKPLLAIEEEARSKKIGVWSCPNPFLQ